MIEDNRYCTNCYIRLTHFEGREIYYCWNCKDSFDVRATLSIGDLEVIMQDIQKARREKYAGNN